MKRDATPRPHPTATNGRAAYPMQAPGNDRAAFGRQGEDLAARYCSDHGLTVVDRNWRTRTGELDLICREGRCLVVVEVKARRGASHGSPLEAVTHRKLLRLRRLAAEWLEHHPEEHPADIRIDVVAITWPRRGVPLVTHVVGACR